MPLIGWLLGLGSALAQGTAIWLAEPVDPVATPDLADLHVAEIAPPQGWSERDARALADLSAELEAVRPLMLAFDGELEIMARLGRAIADVQVIRNAADRELLTRALLFQGFAVHRAFQDALATDPAAEPHRILLGSSAEIAPWVDAVALDPERTPGPDDIPEEPERLAFETTRARVLAMPRATLELGALPPSARASVDGRPLDGASPGGPRAAVVPGLHRVAVWEDGEIAARATLRVGAGEIHAIRRRPTSGELRRLADALATRDPSVRLPETVSALLERVSPPVHLVVPAAEGHHAYRVEGTWALYLPPPPEPEPEPEPPRLLATVEASGAAAWLLDPSLGDAHHAGALVVGGAATRQLGSLSIAAGVDLLVPASAGAFRTPSGRDVYVRAHPWVGLGPSTAPLRATIGALTPGHLALGARAWWPPEADFAVSLSALAGVGVDRPDRPALFATWLGFTSRLRITGRSAEP